MSGERIALYREVLVGLLSGGLLNRMVNRGWATLPAKTAGYEHGRRAPESYADQPMRTHILNGLFGITRLVTYLAGRGLYAPSVQDFDQALRWYVLHDFNKDPAAGAPQSVSEFDIPLERYRQAARELGLDLSPGADRRLSRRELPRRQRQGR